MKMPIDNPDRLVECLKSLGITKYEALVYIALLRVPSARATEIHETSGVPRASVYPVLDQLLEKDLVSVSQSVPKRFAAISPDDAISRLISRIEHDAETARETLQAIHRQRVSKVQESEELIWNLYGIENIRKRLADIISGAEQEIRIIAHPEVLSDNIRSQLSSMADRVEIEIVTSQWKGSMPKKILIHLKNHPAMPRDPDAGKDMMAGGICIIDGRRVMVIVGSAETDAVALYSESEGFVRFFVRYYNLIIDWAKKQDIPPLAS